eukprot:1869684-Prymnesium_polylepis.1
MGACSSGACSMGACSSPSEQAPYRTHSHPLLWARCQFRSRSVGTLGGRARTDSLYVLNDRGMRALVMPAPADRIRVEQEHASQRQ